MNQLRIIYLCLMIWCILFRSPATGQENYEIRKVTFHGNQALDDDYLLDQMAIKSVSYPEKLFTKEEPSLFSKKLMDLDMERLIKTYQSEGFLNVKASLLPLKANDKRKTVKIDIGIQEGKPVIADSINIKLNEKSTRIDMDSLVKKVSRKLKLKNGERFRDESLNNDIQTIEDAFRNLGYAYAHVTYQLHLDPEKLKTMISYAVDPGPVCTFGETNISGNKHVSEKFIRGQMKYSEAKIYSKSLLSKTRENLYQLQLFRVVSVLPQTDPEIRKNPIPVKIYIEEAPRISTRFGIGYGTEDKFRTFLEQNYRNFLGTPTRLNLYLKHSALEPYTASIKWIIPQIPVKNSSLTVNPFISRNSEPGYETRTYGFNLPLSYRFNNWLTASAAYYLEDVKQMAEAGDEEFADRESEDFPYYKSGMLFNVLFNNSEPQFSPEKGMNISIGYKINGHVFGSDFNYTRLWGDFRTYKKLGDIVLAGRIMAGGINSSDADGFIPVEDRFYAGGSNSVRGWKRSELGPLRENGTPSGGKSILEGNLEMRFPLFWKFNGVFFMDTGNVWTGTYEYHFNKLAYATGPGLRIDTPIGPVRLDLGFPVWNEKKSPQFFISVGQAF